MERITTHALMLTDHDYRRRCAIILQESISGSQWCYWVEYLREDLSQEVRLHQVPYR